MIPICGIVFKNLFSQDHKRYPEQDGNNISDPNSNLWNIFLSIEIFITLLLGSYYSSMANTRTLTEVVIDNTVMYKPHNGRVLGKPVFLGLKSVDVYKTTRGWAGRKMGEKETIESTFEQDLRRAVEMAKPDNAEVYILHKVGDVKHDDARTERCYRHTYAVAYARIERG